MPRQIEYLDGEEVTENHKKQLDTAIRILTAIFDGNAANKEDFAIRFLETVAPYVPVARVEQLFPQVARIEQPPQPVDSIEQPAQAQQNQVPARIEQLPQPAARIEQPLDQAVRVGQQADQIVHLEQREVAAQVQAAPQPDLAMIIAALAQQARPNQPQLPKLDPYDGIVDLSIFKNRFEAHAQEYNWNLIAQANKISLFLKGKAAEVYDKLPQVDRFPIEKVWATFAAHFQPSENEWLARLESLLPLPNQSTREFATKLADYYDRANPKADPSQRNRNLKNKLKSLIPFSHQVVFSMSTKDASWDASVEMIAASLPTLNERDRGESPVNPVNINSISSKQYNNNNFNNRQERTGQQSSSRPQTRFNFRQESNQYRPRSHSIHTTNRTQTDKPKTTTTTSIICMRCQKPGHYARDCRAPAPVQASFNTRNASSSNRRNDAGPKRV